MSLGFKLLLNSDVCYKRLLANHIRMQFFNHKEIEIITWQGSSASQSAHAFRMFAKLGKAVINVSSQPSKKKNFWNDS